MLVGLDNYKNGLRRLIARNDGKTAVGLSGLAATLLAIARYSIKASPEQIDAMRSIKARLKVDRPGMTEKNVARLDQFENFQDVELLLNLPIRIVERAERAKIRTSRHAVAALHAVAIEILLACPMRIGNLAALDLDRHLRWRGQGNSQVLSLAIPGSEVKNEQPIEADLPRETTRLIKIYLNSYRHLISDDPGDWLFPQRSGGPRRAGNLSQSLSAFIYRETGLIMNAHLFRHLAGMLFLKRHPGSYEFVRRILGHKKMATTVMFYTHLENKWALKHYDEEILSRRGKA